jgi:hypothetical protein
MKPFDPKHADPLVANALSYYLSQIDQYFPKDEISVYLVGSIALDDYRPGKSDIDFVTIRDKLWQPSDLLRIKNIHKLLSKNRNYPKFDGIYIVASDLKSHPDSCSPPFVLDNKFHYSGAFAANPITWKYLQEQALVLRGSKNLDVAIDSAAVKRWCGKNVESYWVKWLYKLKHQFPYNLMGLAMSSSEWGVLGISRIYATITNDIILSKSDSSNLIKDRVDSKWHNLLDTVFSARTNNPTKSLGPFNRRKLVIEYVDYMIAQIKLLSNATN